MRRLAVLGVSAIAAAAAVFWWLTEPEAAVVRAPAAQPDVENGRLVFFAGGCASCHATPGQPDKLLLGGGVAVESPVGTFVAPNISPDPEHGIGRWTEEQFAAALLTGVSPEGRHYYPAFPYTTYQRMKPADIRDLFAFVRTLAPIGNVPASHDFPLDLPIVRRGVGLWKLVNVRGSANDHPVAEGQLARGRYLVEALGHCAECHSPRDLTGAIAEDRRNSGGPMPGGGSAPNITPGKGGIGDWTEDDIVFFLKDGSTPEGDVTGGKMATVVESTSRLPDEDLRAIAAYLKSLRPVDGEG